MRAIGTACLGKPSFDDFMKYFQIAYDYKQYSNNGKCTQLLESRLAEFHSTKYCVTFSSGFWALVLSIDCVKCSCAEDILIPSLTYRRLADLVSWCNLRPKFYDINPTTLTSSVQDIEDLIDTNTALVLGVQPMINCFPTEDVKKMCDHKKVPFIMDSVESAFELEQSSRRVGDQAEIEIFSMHASKLLNGAEGGYATTNNYLHYKKLLSLRGFGYLGPENIVYSGGYNAKLNEIHASLALANLDTLPSHIVHHKSIYELYVNNLLKLDEIKIVPYSNNIRSSYKCVLACIISDMPMVRDKLVSYLNSMNILARCYYSPPLHLTSMSYPHADTGCLPNTESISEKFLILPSGFTITHSDVNFVCQVISKFFLTYER